MKPAPFKYFAPRTIEEAVALKAEHGDDAKFLAGGQSLIPTMNFRLAKPEVLIDLNRVAELDFVRERDGAVGIGALTRHCALIENTTIAEKQPLASEAATFVAHPQIRNRGTVCGNLAHADPASELPAVMLALGARMRAVSSQGERWIDAAEFFVGVFTTALRDEEMLAEVDIPSVGQRAGTSFMEVARRPGDYAMMGTAAIVRLDDRGNCVDARLSFCGAGGTPIRVDAAATSLIGRSGTDDDLREAADQAKEGIDPSGNINASADFQRHLAGVLTQRTLRQAFERGQRNPPSTVGGAQ